MPLCERKFKFNQSLLKLYGEGENRKIKLVTMRVLRTAGVEDEDEKRSARCSVNTEKLIDNLSRTRSKIFELAYCNEWDFYFTGTLNPKKYDRTNLEIFHKDLTQFIRDKRKKYNSEIDFLFIPELHEDGQSWHMHGFIRGVPVKYLKQFKIGDKMGKDIAQKVKRGELVYNWIDYFNKFGFCNLERIKSHEGVSKYVTKYITKDLQSCVSDLNAHQYYRSRGLKTARTIKKGTMSANIIPDYSNDYCSVSWFSYSDELMTKLLSEIL